MFNIGCTYSRAFKYAVRLPQWGRVDPSSAALDMQDKIGKVGNTPDMEKVKKFPLAEF